ncbi:GntR family transcriptional regulator [Microbacterium sp. LRZ72]|uniref:GntR family transcriptional regulator n=1 Tax=Microbacterium sp. LRZ72 TaxID=2942481 RepID=UPI0029ACD7B1|nr:GntR family transcriptional regulator [Microbacterium sp. LRZ72]MDX2376261.1 GntR family transcriptional regulator [Microbacterium sp. LRZ72]
MPLTPPPRRLEAAGSALADEVYRLLARAIVDGELAAGERLRDVEIAGLLGVSRTPVREALQRLERLGLVEVAAHRYTRVTTPDAALAGEATEFIGRISGVALELALHHADAAEVQNMAALLDEMIDASQTDDPERIMATCVAFYRAATLACRNRLLIAVIRDAHLPVERLVGDWVPYAGEPARRTESFRMLREAVLARDAEQAERIVREQHPLV